MNEEPTTAPQPIRYRGSFKGNGFDLFVIQVINRLLSLLTLFIYHAWAKARVYRFVLSNMEFGGHRLRFLGQGEEIFKGFVRAILIVGLLYAIAAAGEYTWGVAAEEEQVLVGGAMLFLCYAFFFIGFLLFGEFAFFASRRWRASRISWREIRFRLALTPWKGVQTVIWWRILGALTLVCLPLYYFERMKLVFNHLRFGDLRFKFRGRSGDYLVLCLKGTALSLVTLGIYLFWFLADLKRFKYNNLEVADARFHLDMGTGEYAGLLISNALLILFTLGIALPWVTCRNQAFHLQRLSLAGGDEALIDQAVQQARQAGGAVGEGLEDVLDMDLGMGF